MKKIDWEEAFKNTTFFVIDDELERYYNDEIFNRALYMSEQIKSLDEEDGVLNFIKREKDSINMLITLLDISGERFKRIVSMLRVQHGQIFETEWDHKSTMRQKLLQNPDILKEVSDLFQNGKNIKKFQELIPDFILHKFHIDSDTLKKLGNFDFLKEMVQSKLEVEYYTKYRESYSKLIASKIKPYALKYGLEFIENVTPEGCEYSANIILKSGAKQIVINESYNLTTGQGQTVYKTKLSNMYMTLRDDPNTIVVNILDGAGWIGRRSDCRQIYHNCHFFYNLKTIEQIEQLITEFYNINIYE